MEPLAKGFRMVSPSVAGKSATVTGNKLDLSLGTAKTFLNVQLELNCGINELREQLKWKLELQNAQLRMMLDRYEQILPSPTGSNENPKNGHSLLSTSLLGVARLPDRSRSGATRILKRLLVRPKRMPRLSLHPSW